MLPWRMSRTNLTDARELPHHIVPYLMLLTSYPALCAGDALGERRILWPGQPYFPLRILRLHG